MIDLNDLKNKKEDLHLEYKQASGGVPNSLFETVCAFLNRDGGEIFLGVNDTGEIMGINEVLADRMIADIATTLNNPSKMEPPFLLYPQKLKWQDKTVLRLQVPQSSRIHRLNGVVYDRSADGDFRIKEPEIIARMVAKKTAYYSELRTYPHFDLDSLDSNTIKTARAYLDNRKPDHPWLKLKGIQFFRQAGFLQHDYETGKESLTLAAILLFGKELTIQSVLPQFKIDVLVKKDQVDRYDDRLDLRVNLIESYLKIMPFIAPYLADPFYLEDITRVSLRDRIYRELVANLIVHREYTSHLPARILIFKNKVEFINPCVPHNRGKLVEGNFVPYQKNPLISKFFLQLGWVEEIGSGFANVHKWLPLYQKKAKIVFNEEEVFTATVTLDFANQVKHSESNKMPILKDKNRAESRPELKNKKVGSQPESRPEPKSKMVGLQPVSRPESIVKKPELQPESKGKKVESQPESKEINRAESARSRAESNKDRAESRAESDRFIEGKRPQSRAKKLVVIPEKNSRAESNKGRAESTKKRAESGLKTNYDDKNLRQRILELLKDGPRSKIEIANQLGYTKIFGQLNRKVRQLLNEKFIKQTIPEKPKSRLQKYQLTESGLNKRNKNQKKKK